MNDQQKHLTYSEIYLSKVLARRKYSKSKSHENRTKNQQTTLTQFYQLEQKQQQCEENSTQFQNVQQEQQQGQPQEPEMQQQPQLQQQQQQQENQNYKKFSANLHNTSNEQNSINSESVYRQCCNCLTRSTPLWRRFGENDVLCNACGLYQRINGSHRPVSSATLGRDIVCETVSSFKNFLQNDSFKVTNSVSSNTFGKRTDLQCMNCGTRQTSMWRRNPAGESVCNACGLYFRLNGVARPLEMRRESIRTRKRRTKPMLLLHAMLGPDFFKTTSAISNNDCSIAVNDNNDLKDDMNSLIDSNSGVNDYNNHSNGGIDFSKQQAISKNIANNQALISLGASTNSLEKILNHRPEIVLSKKGANFERITNPGVDNTLSHKNEINLKKERNNNAKNDSSLIEKNEMNINIKQQINKTITTDSDVKKSVTVRQSSSSANVPVQFDYIHGVSHGDDHLVSVTDSTLEKTCLQSSINEFDFKKFHSENQRFLNSQHSSHVRHQGSYQSHYLYHHHHHHEMYHVSEEGVAVQQQQPQQQIQHQQNMSGLQNEKFQLQF